MAVNPETERDLLSLVDELSPYLDEQNKLLLVDFVENIEYGVALEWLWSVICSRKIPLSPSQTDLVDRLAQRMKIVLE